MTAAADLDAILRETECRRRGRPAASDATPECRARLIDLADRAGPKGALAGHLAEIAPFVGIAEARR